MFNESYKNFVMGQSISFPNWGFYAFGPSGYIWQDGTIHTVASENGQMQGWHPSVESVKAAIDKYLGVKPRKPRAKRKYYKVVRVRAGRLLSAAGALPDNLVVEYRENEVRTPPMEGTRLFVFGNLEAAKTFISQEFGWMSPDKYRIYECEVTNPHPVKNMGHACDAIIFWNEYQKYRQKRKNIKRKLSNGWFIRSRVPTGSYYVDSLKLTNQVG